MRRSSSTSSLMLIALLLCRSLAPPHAGAGCVPGWSSSAGGALLDDAAGLQHQDAVETARAVRHGAAPRSRPGPARLLRILLITAACAGRIEQRRRLVEHQHRGRLISARASPSFCRCAADSRLPAMPTWKSSPTSSTARRRPRAVEHLGDELADALRRLGLAVDQAAEQDVVLQRGGGVVAILVVELDRADQRRRQVVGEGVARLQQPLLQRLVDEAQAMARLDIGEGQRASASRGRRRRWRPVGLADARQQSAELRQIVGADEAELLEERMARPAGRRTARPWSRRSAGRHRPGAAVRSGLSSDLPQIGVAGICPARKASPAGVPNSRFSAIDRFLL